MAGVVYTRLLEALKGIGVDVSQQQGSNVKKLAPKNKSTATKPGILASERDSGGNFGTVLEIFKNEAKYIDSMNDAEQMAFLNNIMDYNEFGGPKIKTTSELNQQAKDLGLEFKGLKSDTEDLSSGIETILKTSKTMKEEAEAGLASAKKDLENILKTGGQPLKTKDDKFLGGSMHEEGQIRTGIRQFLQNEYKNGRIKLDDLDKARVMEYSPMTEHDPILVFKRIYGDEAYKKAGSFPGAFEKGEDFNHYRKIFEENMGADLLKVKDKKYVGDGTLILTDEVITPTPDDDMPFAKGGRASFAGGKLVSEIIATIVKKEPIEAMKEVNKVVGKKGKYKNLTKEDINKIVEGTDDWIMQRDPDNLYVYDDGKTIYDDDLTKEQLIEKESRAIDKADEMSVEESLTTMEGLGATQTAERFRLKQKYPGITDDLLDKILIDDNPQRKAEVLATIDEAFRMMEKGKGTEEIIETFKNTTRTKNAKGGRAGFYLGGQSGQSVIEPDLSDIGHGSDSLMARTRMTAPGSQATTSTGLNYLLGEDNDNTRIPFNQGLLVPKPKPYTENMFEDESMTLLKGMYGTGPESNIFLYNEMIKKGNELRKQGVERETVIEIIRKNKDKIDMILKQQTTSPKSLTSLANGGIADLRPGYAGGTLVDKGRRGFLKLLGGTAAGVAALKAGLVKILGTESGAVSKKVIDEVIIDSGSGAPAWLQPLVNKALREGTDISKQAIKDGQVVKSLDTPTGKVDVYYDARTGEIDIDYIGGNTAMGEGVQMRYTPGIADEGTKGVKPADEFEAVESVPEFKGGNSPDGPDLDFGENVTSDVKGLYSDTSELAEIGGQKPLIKDISETIKKKKVLKKMDESPQEFAQEQQPDVYYKD